VIKGQWSGIGYVVYYLVLVWFFGFFLKKFQLFFFSPIRFLLGKQGLVGRDIMAVLKDKTRHDTPLVKVIRAILGSALHKCKGTSGYS